jgi:hypothetical protein
VISIVLPAIGLLTGSVAHAVAAAVPFRSSCLGVVSGKRGEALVVDLIGDLPQVVVIAGTPRYLRPAW